MAIPSVSYTFTNNTPADADRVNQNFTDLINSLTDGSKDISISALTAAGTATLNGNVAIGNATTDDLNITSRLASDFIPKTNAIYDLGSSSLKFAELHAITCNLDGAVTINTSQAAVDFRVASDNQANMIFVDGSADRVGFRTATPSNMFHFQAESTADLWQFGGSEVDNVMHPLVLITDGSGNTCGSIDYNGSLNTSQFTATSDKDYKDNIKDMSGLDIIKKLKPVEFEWKHAKGHKDHGLIAQDVYKVLPNIVRKGNSKIPWGIGYTGFITPLIAAVKDLVAICEDLEKRISKLETV